MRAQFFRNRSNTVKARNPRTSRLTKLTGSNKPVRLLDADRQFLKDLARVGILDRESATRHHYDHLKNGSARSLGRLEQAGIIKLKNVVQNNHVYKTYTFASKEIARSWGGNIPNIGSRRMEFHELVTSRLFLALDKPDDFRIASNFSSQDALLCGDALPDAMYTNNDGEIVFVEADSGHYSKTQVLEKMRQWSDFKQVWGQPVKPSCHVKPSKNVNVFKIGDLE